MTRYKGHNPSPILVFEFLPDSHQRQLQKWPARPFACQQKKLNICSSNRVQTCLHCAICPS